MYNSWPTSLAPRSFYKGGVICKSMDNCSSITRFRLHSIRNETLRRNETEYHLASWADAGHKFVRQLKTSKSRTRCVRRMNNVWGRICKCFNLHLPTLSAVDTQLSAVQGAKRKQRVEAHRWRGQPRRFVRTLTLSYFPRSESLHVCGNEVR